MNKKNVFMDIFLICFGILIIFYIVEKDRETRLLREQNQQIKIDMLNRHKEDKVIIDSLTTMNSYYQNKIKTIDLSLEELRKKYEYEKKKHTQNINEVYTSSDSATIIWFNSTYPK